MEPMLPDPLLLWLVFTSSGKEMDHFSNFRKDAKRESFWNTICIRKKDTAHEEERLKGELWEEQDGEYLS